VGRCSAQQTKVRNSMPKKILIIDDDPIVVKYLQAVFSDNGYETVTAGTSEQGLEVVRREKPDLITLDLQMPGECRCPVSGGRDSIASCARTRI
jgi:CheY-like chemotaxis protein